MVRIAYIENPLTRESVTYTTVEPGTIIADVLPDTGAYVVTLNGRAVNDITATLKDGDQLIYMPMLGKHAVDDVLGFFAAAAIAVFAPGIGGAIAASIGVTSTIGVSLITAGVVVGGMMLVNALMPTQLPHLGNLNSESFDTSPTYGWQGVATTAQIGRPVPVLYGTYKLGGNVIELVRDYNNDHDEYLTMQLVLCEGEIEDITLDDVEVNDIPLRHITAAGFDYRTGTLDQEPFGFKLPIKLAFLPVSKFYSPAYQQQHAVGSTLIYNTPVTITTQSNDLDVITLGISLPHGLFYANDKGGLDQRSVEFRVEYRKTGETDWYALHETRNDVVGTEFEWICAYDYSLEATYAWTSSKSTPPTATCASTWGLTGRTRPVYDTTSFATIKITAADIKPIKREYYIPVERGTTYDVRITKLTKDRKTSREQNTLVWDWYGEMQHDKLSHPYIAKLRLQIKASEQLNGNISSVKVWARRKPIEVYKSDGTLYGARPSNNPAWAAWDLLTNPRYGAGVPYSQIDFAKFEEFAAWCAELVTVEYDGVTYKRPRATFDGVIDFTTDLWSALQKIMMIGRAAPIIRGTKYSVLIDKPVEPTQIFTMGNIVAGSYKTTYIGDTDAPDVVEVRYYDVQNDYAATFVEYSESPERYNKQTLELLGVTEAQHAYRLARYFYWTSKYQRRVVEWDAGVDAIACEVGDVVYFAHDVPAWGHSGRLQGGNTAITVVLDEPVYIDTAKTYSILVRFADDTIEQRTIDTSGLTNGEYTQLPVTADFSQTPQQFDIYTFGEVTKEYKQLRIVNLSRKTDSTFHIVAVDYKPDILDDDDVVMLELPVTSLQIADISNIAIYEHLERKNDGTISTIVDVSWNVTAESGVKFEIYYRVTGTDEWHVLAKNLDSARYKFNAFMLTENVTYDFGVRATTINYQQPLSTMPYISHTFLGKAAPPSNVANLTYSVDPQNGVTLTWSPVPDIDVAGYNVYHNDTVLDTKIAGTSYFIGYPANLTDTYAVEAIDTSGNKSVERTTVTLALQPPVINSVSVIYPNGKLQISVDDVQRGDFAISTFEYRDAGGAVFASTSSNVVSVNQPAPGDYTYGVRVIDVAGFASDWHDVTVTITPPVINGATLTTDAAYLLLTTDCAAGTNAIDHISVVNRTTGQTIEAKSSPIRLDPAENADTDELDITCYDINGNASNTITKVLGYATPDIGTLTYKFIGDKVRISWTTVDGSFPVQWYRVTKNGIVTQVSGTEVTFNADWLGAETITVQATDIHGYTGTSKSITVTIDKPAAPSVSGTLDNTNLLLQWDQPAATLDISHYIISWNTGSAVVDALIYTTVVTWLQRTFNVIAVDVAGNQSDATQFVSTITPPQIVDVSYKVIDNNVILQWRYELGSLPFETAIIKRGDHVDTAEIIGTKKGTFTVVFEAQGGNYTYWVCPKDTAGNVGQCKNVTVDVGVPPDYVLNVNWVSDFSGEKTNVYYDTESTRLYAPINVTTDYQHHFDDNGWSSPQDQVDAGYPVWSQPYPTTATYRETFDYGTTLTSSMVTVDYTIGDYVGTGVAISVDIEISADGSSWELHSDTHTCYATDFRYVRVTLHFSGDGTNMVGINQLTVRLDSKVKRDSGMAAVSAADSGGTFIAFNVDFVDVSSITVTPQGTANLTAVYDFDDVPNPTGFKVLLFDADGNRVDGNVSWQATGY